MIQLDLNSNPRGLPGMPSGVQRDGYPVMTSMNRHKGDTETVARKVALAAKVGSTFGDHLDYPDLLVFDRRNMAV